jgi:xanthine/CO dehydrogenase XdhC/CoxF family maturation factor
MVVATGKPCVFTYDTTGDESSVFRLNMGCRGVVRILLEKADKNSLVVRTMRSVVQNRQPVIVATLIDPAGSIGARASVDKNGEFTTDGLPAFFNGNTEFRESFDGGSGTKRFETPEGSFEFSFNIIQPPIALHIFGAGADAIPLADAANNLGWQVSILDHRPAFVTKSRFPDAQNRFLVRDDEPQPDISIDKLTAAVVMAHNYDRDRENLARLLSSDAFYIGALGPKRRTDQMLNELAERGSHFSTEQLERLFAPAGLDIGADTPESIALSIIAEINAALHNRTGGHLRERKSPIYDRKNR